MPQQKTETLESVLDRYTGLVYGLALTCTGGPVQADTVYQKVFAEYQKKNKTFHREESRKTWMIRSVIHFCNRLPVLFEKPDPGKTCFQRKKENELFTVLCSFPITQRAVLYLSFWEGMTCEEIGGHLFKRAESVRILLTQGRKKLYEKLPDAAADLKDYLKHMKPQMRPSQQCLKQLAQSIHQMRDNPNTALRTGQYAFIGFLCLLIVTLAAGVPKLLIRPPIIPSVFPSVSSDSSDTNSTPKWSQLGISEQYPRVSLGGDIYKSQVRKISVEQIGNLISSVEMIEVDSQKKKHEIDAELFEIKNISTRCAIAVRYEDYDGFYVFVNPSYKPNTLGDLIDSLNLKETLTFGNIYCEEQKNGELIQMEYTMEDLSDVVWALLLDSTRVPLAKDREYGAEMMTISINLHVLGYDNIALSITEDGYLQTNLLGTGKMFYIGKGKTQAFADYIREYAKGRELSRGSGTVDKSQSPYDSLSSAPEAETGDFESTLSAVE